MMDLSLFRDRMYALAIVTICVALFTFYGMLLLTTQYLQNVRGFTPVQDGALPAAVQRRDARWLAARRAHGRTLRHGRADSPRAPIMMAALVVLMAGTARHPVLVDARSRRRGIRLRAVHHADHLARDDQRPARSARAWRPAS